MFQLLEQLDLGEPRHCFSPYLASLGYDHKFT